MSSIRFFQKKGPFPLKEIFKVINNQSEFAGDANLKIYGFESLDTASDRDMTFLNSAKYKDISLKTKAAVCITTSNLLKFLPEKCIKVSVYGPLIGVIAIF